MNFETLSGGANDKAIIVIDGCGYTVKTDKMLIKQLPGGNARGVHSEISNLVIEGNISVDAKQLAAYNNGKALAALVGKANGGIFKNIVNNASVTLLSEETARVAGIVGAVFNDGIIMENCVNNGEITGEAAGSATAGIAGILGYAGIPSDETVASFTDCVTDFARANGAWMLTSAEKGNGTWWLRTPNGQNVKQVKVVINSGVASNFELVNNSAFGVVPALKISLK